MREALSSRFPYTSWFYEKSLTYPSWLNRLQIFDYCRLKDDLTPLKSILNVSNIPLTRLILPHFPAGEENHVSVTSESVNSSDD